MAQKPRYFKGWAIPGVDLSDLPGAAQQLAPEEGETLDALSGSFRIFQYRDGHRFSTDDILVAWYGTHSCPSARRVLDLGSGIGTVGMVSAWRLQGAGFVTIEAQEISTRLARKSVKYNGLEDRYEIREGDFRDPSALRPDEDFDLILGSPPYFPLGTGITSEHPQKIACRFEVRGSVHDYAACASKHLAPGGVFAAVFPWAQKERVWEAARAASLAVIKTREIVLKEGEEPLLFLFLMMREDHLPENARKLEWREPPLIIRTRDGKIHPEYSTVKLSIGFPP